MAAHFTDHSAVFHGRAAQIRSSMRGVSGMPSLPPGHQIDRDEFAQTRTQGVDDNRYYRAPDLVDPGFSTATRLPAIAADQKTGQSYARVANRPVID